MSKIAGQLILVATPIGNLGDLPTRAAETLTAADIICCEDTRHSRPLLSHLGITGKKLISLHEHNEVARSAMIIEQLGAGLSVAVISDAGMPVVSDPGQRLVAAVAAAGYCVTAVPGANAAIMALAVSGLPAERFAFEGFLPASGAERRQRLEAISQEARTIILYESPHRLKKTVSDLAKLSGPERQLVITRELTKLHEEVWRGSLTQAIEYVAAVPPRGEYTLVLEGARSSPVVVTDDQIIASLRQELASGVSRRSAVDAVAIGLGVPRKRVYGLALQI